MSLVHQSRYIDLRTLIDTDPPHLDDPMEKIEELTRQLALARQNVTQVEEEIKKEKSNAGLNSTCGSKKSRSTVTSKKQGSRSTMQEQAEKKEYNDVSVQYSARSRLSPASHRLVHEFDDTIDLDADEELWDNLPKTELSGRFKQYREMSKVRIVALEKEIQKLIEKMERKVMTLKAQYNDQKGRWENERKRLVNQIEEIMKLQTSAESDTDQIMETLEKFVDEQEQIESPGRVQTAKRPQTGTSSDNITDDDKARLAGGDNTDTVEDTTAEDMESAKSRASSRNKVKEVLEERKNSIQGRRSQTPAVSLKSAKSGLSQMSLDEDGDLPIPPDINDDTETVKPDEVVEAIVGEEMEGEDSLDLVKIPSTVEAIATTDDSCVSSEADITDWQAYTLAEHPVVKEFLKVYKLVDDCRLNFQDKETNVDLAVLPTIEFSPNAKIQPQLENMTKQIESILAVILQLFFKKSEGISGGESTRSLEAGQISVLQQQISQLEQIIEDSTSKYETELNKNKVSMEKMELKMGKMKRELSMLGRIVDDETPNHTVQDSEVPIMFTRLDMERNGKIMKRAVTHEKLDQEKYKGVLNTMDSYVSIPAKRFVHLVRKYVHHRQMRDIEESVKKSRSINDNVFHILDKMESLQNVRAQKWADYMDSLSVERVNLAQLLMQTLDEIEQESGIFLIKPMYSLKGRDPVTSIYSKYGHASGNKRRPSQVLNQQDTDKTPRPEPPPKTPSKMGYSVRSTMEGSRQEPRSMMAEKGSVWVAPMSEAYRRKVDDTIAGSLLNTPRILELDINRMLIGQNTISAKLAADEDQVRYDQALRSYVTINRPQATQLYKERSNLSVLQRQISFEGESAKLPPI